MSHLSHGILIHVRLTWANRVQMTCTAGSTSYVVAGDEEGQISRSASRSFLSTMAPVRALRDWNMFWATGVELHP
eukprot:15469696-Alexandrium_andersonii.AAC.1